MQSPNGLFFVRCGEVFAHLHLFGGKSYSNGISVLISKKALSAHFKFMTIFLQKEVLPQKKTLQVFPPKCHGCQATSAVLSLKHIIEKSDSEQFERIFFCSARRGGGGDARQRSTRFKDFLCGRRERWVLQAWGQNIAKSCMCVARNCRGRNVRKMQHPQIFPGEILLLRVNVAKIFLQNFTR